MSQSTSNELSTPDSIDDDWFTKADSVDDPLIGQEDLEAAVPDAKKPFYQEVERYWVIPGKAMTVIYNSTREGEYRYVLVEPHLTDAEEELLATIRKKLRRSLDPDDIEFSSSGEDRQEYLRRQRKTIRQAAYSVMSDMGLVDDELDSPLRTLLMKVAQIMSKRRSEGGGRDIAPLSDEQEQKLTYYLVRDFVDFGKINAIMQDPGIEDIKCPGYNSKVHVHHVEYEGIPTNIGFGTEDLDRFITSTAQRVNKGISLQNPQIDAKLPDGSRAQLDYGEEVSPSGSNFTIRKFNAVPYTPVDLINWGTFDIHLTTNLWLLIQGGKSVLFSGGTASGKTTALNAFALCIEASEPIVSIEDTREVELPHNVWVPNVTRESEGDSGSDIDEYGLLRAALRKRPNYIVMGEIRGQEGRTLLQAAASGHTVATTFHAANPQEVIERFTSDPINAAKPLFNSLDVITSQKKTTWGGTSVRRCSEVVEVLDDYTGARGDEDIINTKTTWRWDSDSDEFVRPNNQYSVHLRDVAENSNWGPKRLEQELQRRQTVLAYLIDNEINTYSDVAATMQAYMSRPEDVLALMAQNTLTDRLDHLRTMQSVDIDVDPRLEETVPRPRPGAELKEEAQAILRFARREIFPQYEDREPKLAQVPSEEMLVKRDEEVDPSMIAREIVRQKADEEDGDEQEGIQIGDDISGNGEDPIVLGDESGGIDPDDVMAALDSHGNGDFPSNALLGQADSEDLHIDR